MGAETTGEQHQKVPSPWDFANDIQTRLSRNEGVLPSEGAVYYMVSQRWWSTFKTWLSETISHMNDGKLPESIDNLCLLEHGSVKNPQIPWGVKLRSDLNDTDYHVCCKELWSVLEKAVGGGPAIAAWGVRGPDGAVALEAQVPIKVGIWKGNCPEVEQVFYVARALPFRTFRAIVAKSLFEAADAGLQRDYALYDWMSGPDRNVDMAAAEGRADATLADVGILENSRLMFAVVAADSSARHSPSGSKDGGLPLPDSRRSSAPLTLALCDRSTSVTGVGTKVLCGPGTLQAVGPSSRLSERGECSSSGSGFDASDVETSQPVSAGQLPGLTGLRNMGNTCYMNSALQCLAHTVPLVRKFLSLSFINEINESNPLGSKGTVARAFGSLLARLWRGGVGVVTPRGFKRAIRGSLFDGYEQHDSQEFMMYLLDMLDEDLNRVREKPMTQAVEANGRPDEIVAQEAWRTHRARHDSVVVDYFHGLEKATDTCTACGYTSVKFHPLMYLITPIPAALPREFTLVPVECEERPMLRAVRCARNETVGGFLAAVGAEIGVAAAEVPALLVVALWAPFQTKLTILEDPAAALPPKSLERLVVYMYRRPEAGPRGKGSKTIILPPRSAGPTFLLRSLPLLLWVPSEDIMIEDDAARAQFVVKRDCALIGHVDVALKPFKRHRHFNSSERAQATPVVGATCGGRTGGQATTLTPQMGHATLNDGDGDGNMDMDGASEGGSTVAVVADNSETGGSAIEVLEGHANGGVVDTVLGPTVDVNPDESAGEDDGGMWGRQGVESSRTAGHVAWSCGDSVPRIITHAERSDSLLDGVSTLRTGTEMPHSVVMGKWGVERSAVVSGSAGGGGVHAASVEDVGCSRSALVSAAPRSGLPGGRQEFSAGLAGGSLGGTVPAPAPFPAFPSATKQEVPEFGAELFIVEPPSAARPMAPSPEPAPSLEGEMCSCEPEGPPRGRSIRLVPAQPDACRRGGPVEPCSPSFRLIVVTGSGVPLSVRPEGPPDHFRLELPEAAAEKLFDLEAMARPLRHMSASIMTEKREHTLESCISVRPRTRRPYRMVPGRP